jgi:hypothetical protein
VPSGTAIAESVGRSRFRSKMIEPQRHREEFEPQRHREEFEPQRHRGTEKKKNQ